MRRVAFIVGSLAVLAALWATMTESGQLLTGRWSFTEAAQVDRGTYFRLKVDLTYNGEPQQFDIVVGCHVHDIVYKDGNTTHEVGLIPTLYGRRMSDGKALVVRAPNACGGETTANGHVPADFTPLLVVYEDAGKLDFGAAYLSEDAYDSPLSQLRFGKATIEASTRAAFDASRKDGPPNLIQPAQYAPWFGTEPMPQMALTCFALERYRIPHENQAKLDPLRPPDAPRFWWLAKGQEYPFIGADFQRDDGGKGHDIGHYVHEGVSDYGAPRRNGGGTILLGSMSGRPAASYYPISIPEFGLPEGHGDGGPAPEENTDYVVDAHVENGKYRGFAYCPQAREIDPSRKVVQRIDGEVVADAVSGSRSSIGPLFEGQEYFYRHQTIHLDSMRGGI
jgi:hypothetical protein